jgi:hypothetical protein
LSDYLWRWVEIKHLSFMKICLLLIITFFSTFCNGQTILNGYAEVASYAGTSFTIGVSDETNDAFNVGEAVIIIQMQGASIAGFTSNTASFGSLSQINFAGKYKDAVITSVNRDGLGNLTSIDIASPSLAGFNANGTLQLVTYPYFGGTFTSTSDITCKAWDGKIGGVLAFRALGDFVLQHNISVDGKGFSGGQTNAYNEYVTCDDNTYVSVWDGRHAQRGHGISNDVTDIAGRGKKVTGGGGGNDVNAGGGGGGSFTAGGEGGLGWTLDGSGCSPQAGGQGGLAISSFMTPAQQRLFMGGGAGGGHLNDNGGYAGGNGGGIIFLRAARLVTTGSCAELKITANGLSSPSGFNDGQGGGGAGGSIFLDIAQSAAVGTCPVLVSANGGNGGSVNDFGIHGGGGGGGHGAIYNTIAQNDYYGTVNFETINGQGGANSTGANTTRAEDGEGANNTGIYFGATSILANSTIKLFAKKSGENVQLDFSVTDVTVYALFEIEFSNDLNNWTVMGSILSNRTLFYTFNKKNTFVSGKNYYYRIKAKLKISGINFSNTVLLKNIDNSQLVLTPNPVQGLLTIKSSTALQNCYYTIVNNLGQVLAKQSVANGNTFTVATNRLSNGVYYLTITSNLGIERKQFIVKH